MPTIALTPAVSINGTNLLDSWQAALVELRVEREFQVPARCTLRFTDPGYVLAASGTVTLGASISVSDAANSALTLVSAEVTSIAVDQRTGEQPELIVVAHDKSHRLGRATDVKTYLQMSYSDVVATIAGNCGLAPDTDSTNLTVDYLMQADSDLGLLTELAHRVGYDWWVDEDMLKFKTPASTGTVSLTLGDDLRSFSVRAAGHRPDSVTIDGWDRKQQQLVTATAATPSEGVTSSSDLADLVATPSSAFGSATLVSAGLSAQSQTEATQLSQAILDRASAASVTAQGITTGNGNLKLGVTATISQAGPLSGSYPVTQVEHVYRPRTGYVTKFLAGDRRPRTLVDSLAGVRAFATPATVHPGLSVGQVTNINDPDNGGKVKVKYPGLGAEYETGWARVVSVGGGANRGNVFIPEVNDEVLVGFEGGDPRQPVVIGGLFGSSSTIPTTTIAEGKVAQRAMTSRLGHVVQLLDGSDDAAQAIELKLAASSGPNSIHLGKDKLAISIASGTPIEITAGNTSFKIGSDGSMTLSAGQISITGTEKIALSAPEIDVSGDTQLNLSSDAAASLKGATLQVQSEGPLSMTGEPVSIN